MTRIKTIIDDLTMCCTDKRQHEMLFENFLKDYGYKYFTVGVAGGEGMDDGFRDIFLHTTFPEAWLTEYTRKNYASFDCITDFAMEGHHAFTWDDAIEEAKYPIMAEKIIGKAGELGMRHGGAGLTFPGPSGQLFGVSMIGDTKDTITDLPNKEHTLNEIYYVCHAFVMQRFHHFGLIQQEEMRQLSSIQKEILLKMADFNTYPKMADIAKSFQPPMNKNTLKYHCHQIYNKLGISNSESSDRKRYIAVIESCRRNLISL